MLALMCVYEWLLVLSLFIQLSWAHSFLMMYRMLQLLSMKQVERPQIATMLHHHPFLMMIRVTHAVTRTSKVFKVKLQIATTNRPRMSKRNKSCPQHAPAEESTQGKARANDWASCCNARLPYSKE